MAFGTICSKNVFYVQLAKAYEFDLELIIQEVRTKRIPTHSSKPFNMKKTKSFLCSCPCKTPSVNF
ncbi:hypothetical protein CW304_09810 [Bacillus sp. UFRGS-B20]|nr:hypothetical protein CW304_09810 [Bacillus sp. UFRGS-B20]